MWAAPALLSHPALPPPRSALIAPGLSPPQHYCTTELERGGMLDDMNHVNMLRGGGCQPCVCVCVRPLARCHTVHYFSLWKSRARLTYADPLWWLWQPFVRSKRFLSKQNQSPPPSSAAESSGARSLPASLFKTGLKRRADLHSTFTFGKKLRKNLLNLGWESAECFIIICCLNWKKRKLGISPLYIEKCFIYTQGHVSLFTLSQSVLL